MESSTRISSRSGIGDDTDAGAQAPLECGGDSRVGVPIASADDLDHSCADRAMTTVLEPGAAQRQVELAASSAAMAHLGQRDKLGAAYIMHPARIAAGFNSDPRAAAAAWLHDVIEDTAITAEQLREAGIAEEIVEATVLLTRTNDVASEDYYARIAANPLARRVKLADIDDNTLPWRTAQLDPQKRAELATKYANARQLMGAETNGAAATSTRPADAEETA